ncbi:MAG TPA: 5-deoxy-glucuronate isomerase [Burkholderiaceae bacterium]|nr:5-deoxy-glucuronate isomerase [Burkholderiaceae bacterium]
MTLIVKGRREGRDIVAVTPASAGWRYVGFSAHRLARDESIVVGVPGREVCIVALTGTVSVTVGDRAWSRIGGRRSVFDHVSPHAVYLPPAARAEVVAHDAAEVALCSAPAAHGDLPARLIEPSAMKRSVRGSGTNTRYVCDILPQQEPAESLLVVEVLTPAAHSSSYPPHKHDRDLLPHESLLEETYYHRIDPPQGFGFQRVYTDDRTLDEAMTIEDHDVVMVPRGYHPVVMPHGYGGYYLNTMAGPTRQWHFHNDPAHEWMLK